MAGRDNVPKTREEPAEGAEAEAAAETQAAAATGAQAAAVAEAGEVAAAQAEVEQQRILLHMPVDVRNVALVVIAVLATVFALRWAEAVFVPLLIGVMFSYALTPVVDRLERWHLPRAAGAGLVVSSIVVGLGWAGWSMSDDANALIETLPEIAQKLRKQVQKPGPSSHSTIDRMQEAAAEIERVAEPATPGSGASAASDSASAAAVSASAARAAARAAQEAVRAVRATATLPGTPPGVTRVVIEKPALNVKDYLWTGTLGLMTFLGQLTLVVFIAFFLLASGNTFRRKMVKLAGPRLSQKKITVQALDEIHEQIQRYLLVQMATSIVVGVLTGLAFALLGLNHALVWAVVATVTNLIPYLGAVLVGVASAVFGVVQFEALDRGLVIGAASFAIHTLVGNLLTPWWLGRAGRMNAFAVFVGVLSFGWLWGVWGLLLGVPILMVVKSVCDRIDQLKPVGELLGD
jgi:predicted PurR-regulated permease PerM